MLGVIDRTQSWQEKTALQIVNQGEFAFYSKNDIIYFSNLSINDLLK